LSGCNEAQIQALKERALSMEAAVAAIREDVAARRAEVDKLDARIESMPEGSDKTETRALRDAILARLDLLEGQLEQAEGVAERVNAELENVRNWKDIAGAAAEGTAPLLPPPWDYGLLALAGALGLRARHNRNVANANRRANKDTGRKIGLPL
jgi:hypothetical protein